MLRARVIPSLLLINSGLYKGVRFRKHRYIGDPINTVKIFNDKEVDELMVLDITATLERRRPDFNQLAEIVSEAFMPVAYGGGVRTIDDIKMLISTGIEKVCLNSVAVEDPALISKAADIFGSQSVVISIDVRRTFWGKLRVCTHSGKMTTNMDPREFAKKAEQRGAGEILLNSVDRDGTMNGYDLTLIKTIAREVNIPIIACGGAGTLDDFRLALTEGEASAVAAGSFFVFQGPHRAVLINYPDSDELDRVIISEKT